MPLPDCAHCSSAATLEPIYMEMGVTFAICSCCGKTTRIDHHGIAHKVEPLKDVRDVLGTVMYE